MIKPIDYDFNYKAEVKKCKIIENVMGNYGLIQSLVKDVLENILEGEMEEHLIRNKYERSKNKEPAKKNYRNGYSAKNLRRPLGDVDLDVPRDRKAEFEQHLLIFKHVSYIK